MATGRKRELEVEMMNEYRVVNLERDFSSV